MLMTEQHLTEHAEKLLAVLRGAGGEWVNRSYIAGKLGRNKLYVWDTALLDRMVDMGLIEAEKRPREGPINFEYVYRAVE